MEVLAGARDDRHLGRLRGLLARAVLLPTLPVRCETAAGLYRSPVPPAAVSPSAGASATVRVRMPRSQARSLNGPGTPSTGVGRPFTRRRLRRRPLLFAALIAGLVVFVAISALLARVFSLDADERSAITALVRAEARGDSAGIVALMYRCDSACRARAAYDAAHLRHPGPILLPELNTSAGFSLTSTLGTARVVWTAGASLPVVQCVRVRRAGNVISGFSIELLRLSKRIPSDADCPARF
jgi:hypothetical protein